MSGIRPLKKGWTADSDNSFSLYTQLAAVYGSSSQDSDVQPIVPLQQAEAGQSALTLIGLLECDVMSHLISIQVLSPYYKRFLLALHQMGTWDEWRNEGFRKHSIHNNNNNIDVNWSKTKLTAKGAVLPSKHWGFSAVLTRTDQWGAWRGSRSLQSHTHSIYLKSHLPFQLHYLSRL